MQNSPHTVHGLEHFDLHYVIDPCEIGIIIAILYSSEIFHDLTKWIRQELNPQLLPCLIFIFLQCSILKFPPLCLLLGPRWHAL